MAMAAHGVRRAGGRRTTGLVGPADGRARHQGPTSVRRWDREQLSTVPEDHHQSSSDERASARATGKRRWTGSRGWRKSEQTSTASVCFGARARRGNVGAVTRRSGRSGSAAGVLRHERRAGRGGQGPGTSGADAHQGAGRTSVWQGAGG